MWLVDKLHEPGASDDDFENAASDQAAATATGVVPERWLRVRARG
jgi:hypothetical protein